MAVVVVALTETIVVADFQPRCGAFVLFDRAARIFPPRIRYPSGWGKLFPPRRATFARRRLYPKVVGVPIGLSVIE